jgi:phage tail sheath gpL-like
MIAQMYYAERKVDPDGQVWILPIADAGGGVAATGTIAFTGPATEAGTLSLYIHGECVAKPGVAVSSGMTATALATAVAAAINAMLDLAVTATATTGTVTWTAKNKGALGNDIDVRMNYLGAPGGEQTPAGIGVTIAAATAGSGDPDLASALATLKSLPFDVIGQPYAGTGDIGEMTTFMSFLTGGRWSWNQQLYGHVFTAIRGAASSSSESTAVSALAAIGAALNDPHLTVVGFYDDPSPCWSHTAALVGDAGIALDVDPAPAPLKNLPLTGIKAAAAPNQMSFSDQQTLLSTGIAVLNYGADGTVSIGRAITTYQKDVDGVTDTTYLDCETLFASAAIVRYFRQKLAAIFPRCKVAPDGTNFGAAKSPIVTPKSATAVIDSAYADMINFGWVTDLAGFQARRSVVINDTAPTELDMFLPINVIPGLMVIASQTQVALE